MSRRRLRGGDPPRGQGPEDRRVIPLARALVLRWRLVCRAGAWRLGDARRSHAARRRCWPPISAIALRRRCSTRSWPAARWSRVKRERARRALGRPRQPGHARGPVERAAPRSTSASTDDLFDTRRVPTTCPPRVDARRRAAAPPSRYHVRPTRRGADRARRPPRPLPLAARPVACASSTSPARRTRSRSTPTCRRCAPTSCWPGRTASACWLRAVAPARRRERVRAAARVPRATTSSATSTGRRPRGRQKLIVREYQQERNQTVVFLLDCGPPDDRARARASRSFDHALNAVADARPTSRRAPAISWACWRSTTQVQAATCRRPAARRGRAARRRRRATTSHAEPGRDRLRSARSSSWRCGCASGRWWCCSRRWSTTWPPPSCCRPMRGLRPRHLPLLVLLRDAGRRRARRRAAPADRPVRARRRRRSCPLSRSAGARPEEAAARWCWTSRRGSSRRR